MSDSPCLRRLTALCLGLCLAGGARAETLTERAAVEHTLARQPSLQAAISDVARTAQSIRAQSSRYRPSLLLDAGLNAERTPGLDAGGGTNATTSKSLVLGADLVQPLAWGTQFDLRVEHRLVDTAPPAPATESTGHGLLLRLGVTQPLLRGFGTRVGEAELRAARLDRVAAEAARDATANDTLSATLQAYWELWYARRALAIERAALALATTSRDDAVRRVEAGAAAPLERLTYETRLAEHAQAVDAAELSVYRAVRALQRAMGDDAPSPAWTQDEAPPSPREAPEAADVRARVLQSAPALRAPQAEVERAEDRLRTAGEATRPRLDLAAWVQLQGLGNEAEGPAFTQVGGLDNPGAHVGLVFELPLSGERNDAERAAAKLAVPAARARLEASLQSAATEAQIQRETLARARRQGELAAQTAALAAQSVEAQQKRVASGAGVPLEVREAEDALRRARLAEERARVDAAVADVRLAAATGELLLRWGAAFAE